MLKTENTTFYCLLESPFPPRNLRLSFESIEGPPEQQWQQPNIEVTVNSSPLSSFYAME